MSYTLRDVYNDQARIILKRMYTSYTEEELRHTRLMLFAGHTTADIKQFIDLVRNDSVYGED
jgi:glutathionyl-hydroquinone reductase